MSLAQSTMSPLGSDMPDFHLKDIVSGRSVSFEDFEDAKGICVIFISKHCPYVQHIADKLSEVAKYYEGSGVSFIAISSNDIDEYPEDSPEEMADMAEEYDFVFPILFDETQEVAQDFTAACTPDFFLYDSSGKLFYRGQFDGSRPGNKVPVTGGDLRRAIDDLLAGENPPKEQKPSSGCSIKWKTGNEPPYFLSG